MKNLQEKLQRLRWQCRRGMLELDLILLAFLEKKYINLNPADQKLFEQLLTYSDQDLYCYLIKHQPIDNVTMQTLIEQINCGR